MLAQIAFGVHDSEVARVIRAAKFDRDEVIEVVSSTDDLAAPGATKLPIRIGVRLQDCFNVTGRQSRASGFHSHTPIVITHFHCQLTSWRFAIGRSISSEPFPIGKIVSPALFFVGSVIFAERPDTGTWLAFRLSRLKSCDSM